jgi:hypothetical protein
MRRGTAFGAFVSKTWNAVLKGRISSGKSRFPVHILKPMVGREQSVEEERGAKTTFRLPAVRWLTSRVLQSAV